MSVIITKAGILDTIQDQGRFGFSKWGINTNGAMDRFAMDTANALVGNELTCPVLELHFPAAEILFSTAALISITGADFTPILNNEAIPLWKTIQVSADSHLRFQSKGRGMRCYLAVHGGFETSFWLNSGSTNLKSHSGGYEGRSLMKNDTIPINTGPLAPRLEDKLKIHPWTVSSNHVYHDAARIAITMGHEWDWLDKISQHRILSNEFSISPSSDRMASFLVHEPLKFERTEQLLSSAVSFGTIQALPSGKLCVLMSDHQTTGGYPRVAHVVSAHLPRFAQISPGEKFMFKIVSIAEAEKMLFSLQSSIALLSKSLKEKLNAYYGIH